jgi:hypothetical protein
MVQHRILLVRVWSIDSTMFVEQTVSLSVRLHLYCKIDTHISCCVVVFLLSTKAGGVGLNLIGANRLIL